MVKCDDILSVPSKIGAWEVFNEMVVTGSDSSRFYIQHCRTDPFFYKDRSTVDHKKYLCDIIFLSDFADDARCKCHRSVHNKYYISFIKKESISYVVTCRSSSWYSQDDAWFFGVAIIYSNFWGFFKAERWWR